MSTPHIILKEVQELLKKGKGFHKFELLHEPSAGGTTVARRIAYTIGTEQNPTIIISQYNDIQTYKGIEKLYQLTQDTPILAIIEEHQIDEQRLNKLRDKIIANRKQLVVVYIKRTFQDLTDKVQSRRTVDAALNDEERINFEIRLSELKPIKQFELKRISETYKTERKFITPFIYGLTAFDEEFQGLESYVQSILKAINDETKIKFITFVCLIGKYIKNPISETSFYNYLSIDDSSSESLIDHIDENLIYKILKNPTDKRFFWEVRHKLIADEVCKQVLSGGNIQYKASWRNGLKNYLIELINVFKDSNNDVLDEADCDILEALFTDKLETKFSKLIEDMNREGSRDSIDMLKYLTETFPQHAYFKQHLARLYEYWARLLPNSSFYDLAIKEATEAVEINDSIDILHTKGWAIDSKIKYLLTLLKPSTLTDEKDKLEENVRMLYSIASDAFEKCIDMDKNSTYGYTNYIYLVTHLLDFGTKHSGYTTLERLFADSYYDWYIDKVYLGLDLIENLRSIRSKSNSADEEFLGIKQSYEKLYSYINKSVSHYEICEKSPGISNELKTFYRNAYIIKTLKSINFANPHDAWSKLSNIQIDNIVKRLKANIRYEPKMYDIKYYFRAIRTGVYSESLKACKDFLIEAFEKVSQNSKNELITSELSYYLYVLSAIQELTGGTKIDDTYYKDTLKFLNHSGRNYKNSGRQDTFEYEWLGKDNNDSLEQMIGRQRLGEFDADEFTNKTNLLAEVKGKIVSSSENQAGKIQFNYRGRNEYFTAFFVPIKGGITEDETGKQTKWRFNEKKYEDNETEVMFYLGFSHSGFRAWQPIPVGEKRVGQMQQSTTGSHIPNIDKKLNANIYDFTVKTVDKVKQVLRGRIKGIEQQIEIPFAIHKTYKDYEKWRDKIIKVGYVNQRYELLELDK